jgi:hypothetical protein
MHCLNNFFKHLNFDYSSTTAIRRKEWNKFVQLKKKTRKFNAKFDNSFVRQVSTLSWPIRRLWRVATGLPALGLCGVTSQNTDIFIVAALRTWNLSLFCCPFRHVSHSCLYVSCRRSMSCRRSYGWSVCVCVCLSIVSPLSRDGECFASQLTSRVTAL